AYYKQKTLHLSEIELTIDGVDLRELYGERNKNLDILQASYPDLQIVSRGNYLRLNGKKQATQNAKANLESMIRLLQMNKSLDDTTVKDLVAGENVFDQYAQGSNPKTTIL